MTSELKQNAAKDKFRFQGYDELQLNQIIFEWETLQPQNQNAVARIDAIIAQRIWRREHFPHQFILDPVNPMDLSFVTEN